MPVMAGGPVQIDHGFVLHRNCEGLGSQPQGHRRDHPDHLPRYPAGHRQWHRPQEHLIALGYAGWSAGQLEQELAENSWLTLPADSDIIFSTPSRARLGAAAAQLGIDMNLISGQAGHA